MAGRADVTSGRSRAWNVVAIETSEGVRLSLPLAGPVSRFLAWLIDELVIICACNLTGQAFRIFAAISTDVTAGITVIAYFVIWVGYGIVFEWRWHGQTIGKRVLRLRVLDAAGMKLQLSQIAIRNLMRFIDALPLLYFVGGSAMLLSRRYQRLGDRIAGTVVLRQRPLSVPVLNRVAGAEKYNSFLEIPHLAARLRQNATPELAHLAYEALLRRDELTVPTRAAVFRSLAARFKSIVQFPDEVTESLTDERYVRNALDVLTSTGSLRRKGQ